MARTVGVYDKDTEMLVASKTKDPQTWTTDDLLASPRAEAETKDLVGIVDGNQITILSPTGDFREALRLVKAARVAKGI